MKGKSLLLQLICWLLLVPVIAVAGDNDLEKEVQSALRSSQQLLVTMTTKVRSGVAVKTEAEELKALTANVRVAHLLLQERFTARSEQTSTLSESTVSRQERMVDRYQSVVEKYLSLIETLPPAEKIDINDLLPLQTLLQNVLPSEQQPLLGTLPYRHLGTPARKPALTPLVVPAYQGGNATLSPADREGSGLTTITPEIAELAKSLDWNPVRIYQWVLANIESEWYWGSMKGAAETLRQKSGNDADQAALLVALLRAANFPARFVRGTIEFAPDISRLQNLLDLNDPLQAVRFLQQAGIPADPVIVGGRVANVQIEHVWVETFVPYANYRGAVLDDEGKIWLPLDTHLKPDGYLHTPAVTPLPAGLLKNLRDAYLATPRAETPLEYLHQRFTTATTKPWEEGLRQRTLRVVPLDLLPAGLQFQPLAVTGSTPELPDELVQTVTFRAEQVDGSELFTLTLPTAEVANRQVLLSYEPETVADQETIDAHAGLSNTPAYLVRLRPTLLRDSERLVVARDGLGMGSDYQLTVTFSGPGGQAEQSARQIVGNLALLGIAAQKSVLAPERPEEEQDAPSLLHGSAQRYLARWNDAETELAAALHLTIARPLPTLVTIGGVLEVTRLLDSPHELTWKGLFVDAGLRRIEVASQAGEEARVVDFMRLSALQGSSLEERIFVDDYQVAAVSTTTVLALASADNALITLDSTNSAALLPTLFLPENIRSDIEAALQQGLTVTLPTGATALQLWSGYGYRKEDPRTGEAGYMLSGSLAGGMTIEEWAESYRKDLLQAPFADPPNRDPLAAAHIAKIPVNDRQSGTVGQQLKNELAVLVTDLKGRPVVGAAVTMSHSAGLGETVLPVTYSKTTDSLGIARFQPLLGEKTSTNPSFQRLNSDDTYATQVGVNLFSAAVASRYGELVIDQPFEVYGRPDQPQKLIKKIGDGNRTVANNPAGSLLVQVVDRFENPVSNAPVTFSVQPAQSTYGPLAAGYRNLELYRSFECPGAYPLWGECPSAATLTIPSTHDGALVNTFLGNTLATKYQVQAALADLPPVTFTLTSSGYKPVGDYKPYHLYISYLSTIDTNGKVIDAGKAGMPLRDPLQVAMFLTWSEASLDGPHSCSRENSDGSTSTYDCWDLVGGDLIQSRKVTEKENGRVTFTPTTGGGSITTTESAGDGIFRAIYTTGKVPALNTVTAIGTAEVKVPVVIGEIFISAGVPLYNLRQPALTSGILPTKTVTLKNDQLALFDASHQLLDIPDQPITYNVYGVDVPTLVNPQIVLLGDGGMAAQNVDVDYTIQPIGNGIDGYTAQSADVDLYTGECTEKSTNDKWAGYMLGSSKAGAGSVIFSRGSVFDPSQQYCVQTRLNRGSAAEIKGDKVKLQTLAVDLDLDSDNNAGSEADGTPRLPSRNPLEEQVEDLIGHPGKVIQPNLRDPDGDKIPGFADGLRTAGVNLFDNLEKSAGQPDSVPFVPVLIELAGSAFNSAKAKITFLYPGSDPALVQKSVDAKGEVRFTPAVGSLRLWSKDGPQSRKTEDLTASGDYITPGKPYTVAQLGAVAVNNGWRLYLEGLTASNGTGDQRIVIQIDPDGDGPLPIIEGDAVRATAPLVGLIPDYNHNREIDDEDRHRTARGDTFYFWINDDDDSGETGGDDIPGEHSFLGELDGENIIVDGVRDLIDFFPVALDVKSLVGIFPLNVYTYRLKSADENLNVVFPELTTETVKNYLVDVPTAQRLVELKSSPIRDNGIAPISVYTQRPQELFNAIISAAATQDSPPVILLEGVKAGTAPLVLEITDQAGNPAFTTNLNLSLDGVEQMFRHVNLIEAAGGPPPGDYGGVADRVGEPMNLPDSENERDKNFVFVHGYNVNGQQARGYFTEMFKRLYWSGSKDKFWGISWYGFESQGWKPGAGHFTPDFHINIEHAWETVSSFSTALADHVPPDETISIAAHSLGNGVVAGFLSDHYGNPNDPFWSHASPTISKVFMMDAAVALEAFSGGLADNVGGAENTNNRNMYHPDWYDFDLNQPTYKRDLWAADWFRLFDDHIPNTVTDKRELLTWRDRYGVMTKLCGGAGIKPGIACYNFFSSGEEVLATQENPGIDWFRMIDDDPNLLEGLGSSYSMVLQDRLKGRMYGTVLWPGIYDRYNTRTPRYVYIAGSICGGWGGNLGYTREIFDKVTDSITLDQLKTKPFFRVEPPLSDVLGDSTLDTLTEEARMKLLADCIPALTLPAGGPAGKQMNNVFDIENVVNMQELQSDWPDVRKNDNDSYWKHSDLREVAYPFVKNLFFRLTGNGSSTP